MRLSLMDISTVPPLAFCALAFFGIKMKSPAMMHIASLSRLGIDFRNIGIALTGMSAGRIGGCNEYAYDLEKGAGRG